MARNGISGRERICLTCNNPSPGPIKHLCYRWRLHGPFFPLLERLKTDENSRLFVNGRVPVCTSCANYLQRQWNDYERKSISLPIEKRTYRLLSDDRWEKLNHKKQLDEEKRKTNENEQGMSSYEENDELIQEEKMTTYNTGKLPASRKSKIPRLKKRRAEHAGGSIERLRTSLAVNEAGMSTSSETREKLKGSPSTAGTKTADGQTSKLVRKMAEIKFQEEEEYIQRKVQKTMTMVHFKGRDERIQEIEEELKEKIEDGFVENGVPVSGEEANQMIIPAERSNTRDSIAELKGHIDRQMMMQRHELAKFRRSIKAEIAQAMDENHNRNQELWNYIIKMNEERRSGRHQKRNRDNAYSKQFKTTAEKRTSKHDKMSDGSVDKGSDDVEYSDYR